MKYLLIKYPLDIQYFADEGNDDGTDTGTDDDTSTDTDTGEQTFTQADIDRAVTQAVQTRNAKLQGDIDAAVEAALAEKERIDGLTEEQRQEEAQNQANQRIADKEAELNLKVLRVDVGQELVTRGLSSDLLDLVLGEDLESSIAKIETVSALIDKGVEEGIKTVVTKPGAPKKPTGKVITKEEIMAVTDQAERQKLIKENIELFD